MTTLNMTPEIKKELSELRTKRAALARESKAAAKEASIKGRRTSAGLFIPEARKAVKRAEQALKAYESAHRKEATSIARAWKKEADGIGRKFAAVEKRIAILEGRLS